MIGRTLDRYRIEAKLGEGGMGVVYRALDTHLNRTVAIKVLPQDRVVDPDRKRRFLKDAQAASALNHPNIITVHDIRSDGGVDFIVMEHAEGRTLEGIIPASGLRVTEALRYGVQILVAANLGNVGPGLAVSRDGRTILFARTDSSSNDLMLVENYR